MGDGLGCCRKGEGAWVKPEAPDAEPGEEKGGPDVALGQERA
jgi:hypothetical protein